ncbi:hypothetical protein CWI38_0689p0040, partial [Hamiltosporidium tvaerminnensis]
MATQTFDYYDKDFCDSIPEQCENLSTQNHEMESESGSCIDIDELVDREIELQTADNVVSDFRCNNHSVEFNPLESAETTNSIQLTDKNETDTDLSLSFPTLNRESLNETTKLTDEEIHLPIQKPHESRLKLKRILQQKKYKKISQRRTTGQTISDFDQKRAIKYIKDLHSEVKKDISKIEDENNLLDMSEIRYEYSFRIVFKRKIQALEMKRFKRNEDLACELKFAKSIICHEKKFMKNLPLEEKNLLLSIKFKLKNFEENILDLKKYHILSEIPFLMYSYNKGSISLKEDCVFYVSYMFKILEVCYLNSKSFIGLENQFFFEYNHYIISLRLIFFNILSGIKNFECNKNFYIVISSLIYFYDIGGIRKLPLKRIIYYIQLNILLNRVFLNNFDKKEVEKAIEFYESELSNESGSQTSYTEICFKKFFKGLQDIDLLRKYTEICMSSIIQANLSNTVIDTILFKKLDAIFTKYANKKTYTDTKLEYLKDLFVCETIMTRIHSRIIYEDIKLKKSFYNSSISNFIEKLDDTLRQITSDKCKYSSRRLKKGTFCYIQDRNVFRDAESMCQHFNQSRKTFKSLKQIRSHSIQEVLNNEIKIYVKIRFEKEKLRKYDLLANGLSLIYNSSVEIVPYVMTWNSIVTEYHK